MILVIDALNRPHYPDILDEMFRLRARVFGERLGWEVNLSHGREMDRFDALDPTYVIGLDDDGHVISCVRALQTTGPHMLADVFSAILNGTPPRRSATVWESTRFCVDTGRLGRGQGRNTMSWATCELMIGSLEYARACGITEIVTVIDPVMDRVLKRSDNAPCGYLGQIAPMGKVSALAALLDTTPERVARLRAFAGIEGDVFADEVTLARLRARRAAEAARLERREGLAHALLNYLDAQHARADTLAEREALERLSGQLRAVTGIAPPHLPPAAQHRL